MSTLSISINYATPIEVLAGTRNDVCINPYTLRNALTSGNLYPISIGALSAESFVGPGGNISGIVKKLVVSDVPIDLSGTTLLLSSSAGTGNITISAVSVNDCPPWYVGQLNQPLLSATTAIASNGLSARISKQFSLSADYLRHLNWVISQNSPMTGGEIVTTPSPLFGAGSYIGGQVLLDGRILLIPYSTIPFLIYNPTFNTVTTPASLPSASFQHASSVLLPDGRVFIPPHSGTCSRMFNPSTNTLTTPGGTIADEIYLGTCLLQDGRVFMGSPYNYGLLRIYNPVTDTYTTPIPDSTFFGSGGTVMFADGRILLIRSTTNFASTIYNPTANILITPLPLSAWGGWTGYNGCLLPDQRVYLPNFNGSDGLARIYNPLTNTLTTPAGRTTGHRRPLLLPDGRVFLSPNQISPVRIYDPRLDQMQTPFTGLGVSNGFTQSVYMGDGKILIIPYVSNTARILSIFINKDFSKNTITGPFYSFGN